MKKLALVLTTMIALTGCSTEKEAEQPQTAPIEPSTSSTSPVKDNVTSSVTAEEEAEFNTYVSAVDELMASVQYDAENNAIAESVESAKAGLQEQLTMVNEKIATLEANQMQETEGETILDRYTDFAQRIQDEMTNMDNLLK